MDNRVTSMGPSMGCVSYMDNGVTSMGPSMGCVLRGYWGHSMGPSMGCMSYMDNGVLSMGPSMGCVSYIDTRVILMWSHYGMCVLHGHQGHPYPGTCPTWIRGSYPCVPPWNTCPTWAVGSFLPWDVSYMDTGVVSMGPTMGRVLHGHWGRTHGSHHGTCPTWTAGPYLWVPAQHRSTVGTHTPQTRPYEDTESFPRVPPQTRTSTPEGPPVPLGAPQAPSPRGDSADLGLSGGTSIGARGSASARGWGRGDRGTPGAAGGAQPPSQHSGGAGVLWGHGWHRCPRVPTQSRERPRGVPFIPGAVGR